MEKIKLKVPIENIEDILGTVTSPSIVLSELIKNSVDSNAKHIRIDINTKPENTVIVSDTGDGLSFDDIKNLGNIGMSNKKINNNLYRKDGSYLTGNKGLGILSLFSIANSFTMETENNKSRYKVTWPKGEASFTCEQINFKGIDGTEIKIKDIKDEYINILTDKNELNKLKHISIKNYVQSNLTEKSILFFKDGIRCTELDIKNINSLKEKFIGFLKFSYESKNNTLNFQYISNSPKINNNKISIKLNNDLNISNILVNYYNLSQITYKGEQFRYLDSMLESFNGEIYVTQQKRNSELHKFGPGVRVFVNQFAMYGYLDQENDWLNFSVYSLLRKNTRYKPHNVFGYVHFENLNENLSNIKISNERAYFIENGAFKKFQEIMKNIVTVLAFNIDVAEKNNWVGNSAHFIDNISNNPNTDYNCNNNSDCKPISLIKHSKKENIEPANKTTIEENPITSKPNNLPNKANATIAYDKKPKFNFFRTSRVLKYPDKIKMEYDDLIEQLSRLNYKEFYLLYVISFRAILENLSKKYLNARQINLCNDFGQNIRNMIDDILMVIKDKEIIKPEDKAFIENRLGGYNAFKNYFESLGPDFYCNGKPGIKASKLNSFTHTPRWMEVQEAEDMANNIILPLYIISKDIINRKNK